jgi:ABC-type Fe3+ transport system substrate-binding protein
MLTRAAPLLPAVRPARVAMGEPMRISNSLAAGLAAFTLAIAATFPVAAQDADWDKVVAAAKQEGKVVVYNSANGADYYAAVVKSFEKKYGITVETLDLRASELSEKIRAEQVAGRFLGDLEQHSTATLERQIREMGTVQPHGPMPNTKNLRPEFPVTEMWVPAWIQAYGVLINTRLVKPADEPKNWHDLLDPKWKGKIISDDTRALGGGNTMSSVTYLKYGEDFLRQLAGQDLVFSRDLRADARRTARGEYPIYIPQMFALASDLKGLPVKVLVMEDGAPYVPINNAMLKNAPHPNAARVFMNHFLDVESQLTYANAWMVPVVVDGVLEKADPEARRLVSTPLMGATPWDRQQELMNLAIKIFTK